MTYALPPINILPAHWDIVHTVLQKHVPSHPVWAFGSCVTDKAKPFSDLDLVIIDNQPLSWDVMRISRQPLPKRAH
ncbi:MAG: nucleotidyltransferase domain-containing protein [Roseiflexaceae bacterium]